MGRRRAAGHVWQCTVSALLLLLLQTTAQGAEEGDVRLVLPDRQGEQYEGRAEWFHDGVWISLCGDYVARVESVICRQLGYAGEGALMFYGGAYGPAPGETYRGRIVCNGWETSLFQCSVTDQENNCDPAKAIGISCDNNVTLARNTRLRGNPDSRYAGRLELFINGVWGTVCRREDNRYSYHYVNPHVACRELFGQGYGGSPIEPHLTVVRFGLAGPGAIFRSQVQCEGTETSFHQCHHDANTRRECTHEEDAGMECFPVPEGCFSYLTEDTGVLQSPRYGARHNYTHDTDCLWKIVTTPDRFIRLFFTTVDTQEQAPTDSLTVVDGNGYTLLSTVLSPTTDFGLTPRNNQSAIFVRLHTTRGSTGIGFNASWVTACGKMFLYTNGRVQSPGYSGPYPPDTDCNYIIRQSPGYAIRLTFNVLQLDGTEGHCQDFITVYDGDNESSPVLGGPYCGTSPPVELTSTQHFVTIRFCSDNVTTSRRGFDISYVTVEQGCGGNFQARLGQEGNVHSPGYPEKYSDNLDCVYIIQSPNPDLSITLNITQSSLESYDYLEIQDGASPSSRRLYRSSSFEVPFVVISSQNALRLRFTTDGSVQYTGWNASYTALCEKVFMPEAGSFQSPGSTVQYPDGMDCAYHIRQTVGYAIRLTIRKIQTSGEANGTCANFFAVYDGNSTSAPLLSVPGCNDNSTCVLTSTGNAMLVTFHVDNSSSCTVPHLTFYYEKGGCGGNFIASPDREDSIHSPGFPGYYPNNLDCVYVISTPNPDFGVTLTIATSSLSYGDYLEIRDGASVSSPQLYRSRSFHNPFVVTTSRNAMRLRFTTDGNSQQTGWNASYSTSCHKVFGASSDSFQSPGYSAQYPAGLNCSYRIHQLAGYIVRLSIQTADENTSCTNFFTVHDGNSQLAPVLANCSDVNSRVVTSTQNIVLVRFHVDNNTASDTLPKFNISYVTIECGLQYGSTSGYIQSPGYPRPYPTDLDCPYYVRSSFGYVVRLLATSFSLDTDNGICQDNVTIYDGRSTSSPVLGGPYCGNNRSSLLFSTGPNITVQFYTEGNTSSASQGYRIPYTKINTACHMSFGNGNGNVDSPGYSGPYPPSLNCSFTIRQPPQITMRLTFSGFGFDADNGSCSDDVMQVYDGESETSPVLGGPYCQSHQLPSQLVSNSSTVLVTFRSDAVTTSSATGFRIYFYAVEPDPVVTNLTGDNGTFQSPGYPNVYRNETDYIWFITTTSPKVIVLTFSDFSLPSTSNCGTNKLEIRDGSGWRLSDPCGTGRPSSVWSNAHSSTWSSIMKIHFISTSNFNRNSISNKFRASWRTECPEIRRTLYGSSTTGYLESYGHPSVYTTNLHCGFSIEVDSHPEWHEIVLNFTYFALDEPVDGECTDYVQVSDGRTDIATPKLGDRYCGSSLPPVLTSAAGYVYIRFHSDAITHNASTGFRVTYQAVRKVCENQLMTAPEGNFTTPAYPSAFPPDSYCVWAISVEPQFKIELTFHDFSVGYYDRKCERAHIRLYDSDRVEATEVIDTLCGQSEVPKITSRRNSLTVVLNSFGSFSSSNTGFWASYKTVKKEEADVGKYALFEYGEQVKDKKVRLSDTGMEQITLQSTFPFGRKRHSVIYVGQNGLISVGTRYPWPNLSPDNLMVCAYCAYIDDSDSVGGIFYHVYAGDKEDDAEVMERATREVREYTSSADFRATLAVVVTWEKVKQGRYSSVEYTPDNEKGEATFQLALISDGQVSYVLVYYLTGNMTWQYRGHWSYVLIGVSSGLEYGEYQLNMYSKTRRAYEIDKVTGNSGRKGIWYYKVGELPPSKDQQCYTWFVRNYLNYGDREVGFSRLPPCPCSFDAVWRRTNFLWTFSRKDRRAGTTCYRLNRANSQQHYPLGKECCYSTSSYKLVMDPPNAGSALAYNPVYSELLRDHVEEDRYGHDICCSPVASAYSCSLYYQLRPVGECQANIPFQFSWMFGDPHIKTLDEREYTFNGWGEYTLVILDFPDLTFTLQGRTGPVETESGKEVNATVFTAFGAEENGTRVFVGLHPLTKDSLEIYAQDADYSRRFRDDGDDFVVDEENFTMASDNKTLLVSFPSGISLAVAMGIKSLAVSVSIPDKFRNQTKGLLGNYNGIKDDDFVLPNGTVLRDDMLDRDIHNQFGQQWSVTDKTSVMRYGRRETAANYSHPDFKPVFLDEMSEDEKRNAEQVCGTGDTACVYDYLSTGSKDFAEATNVVSHQSTEDNAIIKNTLPVLAVPGNITLTLGVATAFQVNATDPDENDEISYALDERVTMATIDPVTGRVTATFQEGQTPEGIRAYAIDSHGGESVARDIPYVVCSLCSTHGQCDFTRTRQSASGVVYAVCNCSQEWTGDDCETDRDACEFDNPCDPLQNCTDLKAEEELKAGVAYNCSDCPKGYSRSDDGSRCLDVDECEAHTHNCPMNCENTDGSYRCYCPAGYRLAVDERTCLDVNECAELSHNCEHICNNTEGSYRCQCHEGFSLDAASGDCQPDGNIEVACEKRNCSQGCRLLNGTAQCFCRYGYDLDPDGVTCVDRNECEGSARICAHNCNNTEGGFTCSCYIGYKLNSDNRTCSPCSELHYGHDCQHVCMCSGRSGVCDHVTGCVCDDGWTGSECKTDLDECAENPDKCGEGVLCVNTEGSYSCQCPPGYAFDEDKNCADVNECDSGIACGPLETCRNIPGSFHCTCLPGYLLDNGTCVDMDECAVNNGGCEHECKNVGGSYNCECFYGYTLHTDRSSCTKIREPCSDNECDHGCTLNATDHEVCFCRSGYTLQTDGTTCRDINECDSGLANCSHTCNNTAGGFFCSCPLGMVLGNDHVTCTECPRGTWGENCSHVCNCGLGADHCDVTSGCVCREGWHGDRCADDINECQNETVVNKCQEQNAGCFNFRGGYRCQCRDGYTFDNDSVCQDIDECATSPCSQICVNTRGSFHCQCNEGYSPDGETGDCKDIDECRLAIDNECNQVCQNMEGSYRCYCDKSGYVLSDDGHTCTARTGCARTDCDTANGGCSVDLGQETCFCNSGYELGPDNTTCSFQEIDWCGEKPCDQGCEVTEGGRSFTCSCGPGYLLNHDQRSCSACPEGTYGEHCAHNCTCHPDNTESCDHVAGTCTCLPGWEGSNCAENVNECEKKACGDHSVCSDTPGSFVCRCKRGYYMAPDGNCTVCKNGTFGQDCEEPCECSGEHTESCDHLDGRCYCQEGWERKQCNVSVVQCSENQARSPDNQCIETKSFEFTMTISTDFEGNLSDSRTQDYRRVQQQLEKQLFDELSASAPVVRVEVIAIWRGSIGYKYKVYFEKMYNEAAQKMATAIRDLLDAAFTVDGVTAAVAETFAGDDKVDKSISLCDILMSMDGCNRDDVCDMQDGVPVCRPLKPSDSDSDSASTLWLVIGLAAGVPLVIVVCLIAVCRYMKKKQLTDKQQLNRSGGKHMEDTQEENDHYHTLASTSGEDHLYRSFEHMKTGQPVLIPRCAAQSGARQHYVGNPQYGSYGQDNQGYF